MSIVLQIKLGDPVAIKRYRLDPQYKSIGAVQHLVEQCLGGEMYVLLEDADTWTTLDLPRGCTVSVVDERLLNGEV